MAIEAVEKRDSLNGSHTYSVGIGDNLSDGAKEA
jgi:hypothetical protein